MPPEDDAPTRPAGPGPAELLAPLERLGIKLGLERMARLLAVLGDPQRAGRPVLVAGTNGKGSTAAFLTSVLEAAGVGTGLYTSPHLEEVEERVRLGGRAIASDALAEVLARVLAASRDELGGLPTYFEAMTAAAFLGLAAAGVEVSVLEVGLGGRLDATNTCEPVLSVVTGIGLDHTRELGDAVGRIAREKAGIFRPGVPALAWVEEREAWDALEAEAERLRAPLEAVDRVVRWTPAPGARDPLAGERGRLWTPRGRYDLSLGLLGEHQVRNAALAVRAAERLGETLGRSIGPEHVEEGIRRCRWPGRLERVELPRGRRVLLDAAHNPQGAATLARFLERLDGPRRLLFGVLDDKDGDGMLAALGRGFERVVLTRPPGGRGLAPTRLRPPPGVQAVVVEDPDRALEEALPAGPGLLVVCGSIYLLGTVRGGLRGRFGVPPPAASIDVTGRPATAW